MTEKLGVTNLYLTTGRHRAGKTTHLISVMNLLPNNKDISFGLDPSDDFVIKGVNKTHFGFGQYGDLLTLDVFKERLSMEPEDDLPTRIFIDNAERSFINDLISHYTPYETLESIHITTLANPFNPDIPKGSRGAITGLWEHGTVITNVIEVIDKEELCL